MYACSSGSSSICWSRRPQVQYVASMFSIVSVRRASVTSFADIPGVITPTRSSGPRMRVSRVASAVRIRWDPAMPV